MGLLFILSCVKYNSFVSWPCHWRWKPWQMLNTWKLGCERRREGGMFCFRSRTQRQRYKNEALAHWLVMTDYFWPLEWKTFQGTSWWDEVAAIKSSHILKINTCFHTSSLAEVSSFSQVGHPVADPWFLECRGSEDLDGSQRRHSIPYIKKNYTLYWWIFKKKKPHFPNSNSSSWLFRQSYQ